MGPKSAPKVGTRTLLARSCKRCHVLQPPSEFGAADGCWDPVCKSCHRRQYREQSGPWVRHGLTREQFEEMWDSQGGLCGICPTVLVRHTWHGCSIDHDHSHESTPGHRKGFGCADCVRGLLCQQCNFGLDRLENREWWDQAVAYLRKPRPVLVRVPTKWVKTQAWTAYGMSTEQWIGLVKQQGGCGVCGTEIVPGRLSHVDHDHKHCRYGCLDCVRGVLCQKCNHGLHWVEKDGWYVSATAYLEA